VNAAALVGTLRARGVSLEPHGDRLRIRPASAVRPEEVEALRRNKAAVIALLRSAPTSVSETATAPTRDLIADYREVLGRLWLLNIPGESRPPRAHQTDVDDARRLLAEQARLCDELGPALASAVARQAARGWVTAMGRCPWCGESGPFHDPARRGEVADA
jgi:hypothetical protein